MVLPPEQAASAKRPERLRPDLRSLLFWPGLPLIAAQGLWLRRRAYRAPVAGGDPRGAVGEGPPFRLLALGDSITVGVGLELMSESLPAQLAVSLAARLGRRVHWQTGGRNGATTGSLHCQLQTHREALAAADLLLLSIGVNDATGLRPRRTVAYDLGAALATIRQFNPLLPVLLTGLPPLDAFPLLPSPLRHLLGLRARQIDALLAWIASQQRGITHIPMPMAPQPGEFAADGFHPNAAACTRWATALSEMLADDALLSPGA